MGKTVNVNRQNKTKVVKNKSGSFTTYSKSSGKWKKSGKSGTDKK